MVHDCSTWGQGEIRLSDRPEKERNRRSFMKNATIAIGGAMGVIAGVPLLRYVLHPVRRKIVTPPDSAIDVIAEADLVPGAAPVRLPIVANGVRDAWNNLNNVAIGACWVEKKTDGSISAFTSVCPHLGCSVSYSAESDDYQCPCHNSAFHRSGEKKGQGPSKRGLDPLEVKVEKGRVKVVYQRFRNDVSEREPV